MLCKQNLKCRKILTPQDHTFSLLKPIYVNTHSSSRQRYSLPTNLKSLSWSAGNHHYSWRRNIWKFNFEVQYCQWRHLTCPWYRIWTEKEEQSLDLSYYQILPLTLYIDELHWSQPYFTHLIYRFSTDSESSKRRCFLKKASPRWDDLIMHFSDLTKNEHCSQVGDPPCLPSMSHRWLSLGWIHTY